MTVTPVDALRVLQTPEGVDVVMRVAGPVPRALAWLLDFGLRVGLVVAISIPLSVMGNIGKGFSLLLLFAVEWLYPVLFEVWRGATPGKKFYGLTVVHDDGTPIGWSASLLRNLLRTADFMPFGYAIGLLAMLCDPHSRRLGDLAAGTVVIHQQKARSGADISDGPVAPPLVPLTMMEQRAVIDFAERSAELTPERAEELARLAGPLVVGQQDARQHLAAIARWLLGRR